MRAATLRRGLLSSKWTRSCSPLMVTNSTSLKSGRKMCSSSLRPARMEKFSSTQVLPLMLRILRVLLPSIPIEYGHVLLIPRVLECLPQRIDHESLLLAIHMAVEVGNPYFRLGYNSLGAFATINHLHFQAYYLDVPFPIEKAPVKKTVTLDVGVKISELLKYPVRGLVIEGGNTLQDLSDVVSDACICLQENNIPYNVLIADCGKRVFLLPQCYAEKQALGDVSAKLLDTQVYPAVWEISGHMVLKRKDYEEASKENAWRHLAEVSLSEERFQEVNELIFEAMTGGAGGAPKEDPDVEVQSCDEFDDVNPSARAMVIWTQECLVLQ